MPQQRDNLKNIEDLTKKLTKALHNIDDQTRVKLEDHSLQLSGFSMALLRVQIGIDNTLKDMNKKSKKTVITRVG